MQFVNERLVVVVQGEAIVRSTVPARESAGKAIRSLVAVDRVMQVCVLPLTKLKHYGLLGLVE